MNYISVNLVLKIILKNLKGSYENFGIASHKDREIKIELSNDQVDKVLKFLFKFIVFFKFNHILDLFDYI